MGDMCVVYDSHWLFRGGKCSVDLFYWSRCCRCCRPYNIFAKPKQQAECDFLQSLIMEKIHDYNFCPSCGHALQGDEMLCPFCAYRLSESEIKSGNPNVGDQPQEQLPDVFCPACNTRILPGEIVCTFCGFRIDGSVGLDHHKVVEKNLGKGTEEMKIPVAEVPKEKGSISIHPVSAEIVVPPVIPASVDKIQETAVAGDSGKNAGKKKKGFWILIVAIVIIVLIAVLCILQYAGVINAPILNRIIPANKVVVAPVKVEKHYYYCYASAVIKGKTNMIMSNVFSQEQAGNNMETAKAVFSRVTRLQYPTDYMFFRPVLCKQGDDFTKIMSERESMRDSYMKKKYKMRFVEVH